MAAKEAEPKPPKIEGTEKPPKEKKAKKEKPIKEKKPKKEKIPKEKKQKIPREKGEKKPPSKKVLLMAVLVVVLAALVAAVFLLGPKLLKAKQTSATVSDVSSSETSSGSSSDAEASSSDVSSSDGADRNAEEDPIDAASGAQTGDGSSSSSEASSSEPEKPFEFSEETFELKPYTYQGGREDSALAVRVHNDVQKFLDKRDGRPGVGIAAVVVAGSYTMEDGTLRVLAYAWDNRYAVVENTLFDYSSVAGPCAVDYKNGEFQQVYLPMSGDLFEQTVRNMCGAETEIADRMLRKSYELELRGQMIRNVTSYLARNDLPVEYFRSGVQTYHKNGEIYIPENGKAATGIANQPGSLTEDASSAATPDASSAASTPAASSSDASSSATSGSSSKTDEQLRKEYEDLQKVPF